MAHEPVTTPVSSSQGTPETAEVRQNGLAARSRSCLSYGLEVDFGAGLAMG